MQDWSMPAFRTNVAFVTTYWIFHSPLEAPPMRWVRPPIFQQDWSALQWRIMVDNPPRGSPGLVAYPIDELNT